MKNATIKLDKKHLTVVKKILRQYVPDCEVLVFGSRLTDQVKSYSDLDLALHGKQKIEREKLIELKDAFEESNLPFRVDVLDWHRIAESFRKIIQKDFVIIQKKRD